METLAERTARMLAALAEVDPDIKKIIATKQQKGANSMNTNLRVSTGYERRASWELSAMIKALNMLPALNTPREMLSLQLMELELKRRNGAKAGKTWS